MVSKTNMGEGIRGSKIEAAIREVEALIADREIRDRLAAHRQCKADPVVERGVYDLVAPETTRGVGERHMAHLSAPAFNQRHSQAVRRVRARVAADVAIGRRAELLPEQLAGTLDLKPADRKSGVEGKLGKIAG